MGLIKIDREYVHTLTLAFIYLSDIFIRLVVLFSVIFPFSWMCRAEQMNRTAPVKMRRKRKNARKTNSSFLVTSNSLSFVCDYFCQPFHFSYLFYFMCFGGGGGGGGGGGDGCCVFPSVFVSFILHPPTFCVSLSDSLHTIRPIETYSSCVRLLCCRHRAHFICTLSNYSLWFRVIQASHQ